MDKWDKNVLLKKPIILKKETEQGKNNTKHPKRSRRFFVVTILLLQRPSASLVLSSFRQKKSCFASRVLEPDNGPITVKSALLWLSLHV